MARVSSVMVTASTLLLTALTIGNAFRQKKQFYPSVVYITKSSPSMAVIYLQALVLAHVLFQAVRRIFFGELRPIELEQLSERAWHAVLETCLAFTVFRDSFSPKFVMQFAFLLFVKSFHWLTEDRVDYMERTPLITMLFHCRMISLLAFLSSLDSFFVSHAYFTTLSKGASVQIVFGFEYAVLMTVALHIGIKYLLHLHDLRNVNPWENKAMYLLYTELLINLLRCILYVAFVGVMFRLHTFPLFSMRPLYLTVRAFYKALVDVIQSRRAIDAMNNSFPLATNLELQEGDSTCIICREEMLPNTGAKKLPCSHVFHPHCLRSWFQRQQTCPTCRADILTLRRAAQANAIIPPQQAAAARGAPNAQAAVHPQNAMEDALPNLFPFIAQNFGFNPRLPAQNNNQQERSGATMDNQGNHAGLPPNAQPNLTGFPPIPPPPMPPFPFPTAPSFAGLTDAELATLEGQERSAIENRVNCLRNISTLLDAAVIQLQQYMLVIQATAQPNITASSTQTENSPTNLIHPQTCAASTSGTFRRSDELISEEVPPSSQATCSEHASEATSDDCANIPQDLEEIRKRRLERFS